MSALGREFWFPFSHGTRVDVAVSHLGAEPADVEVTVYDTAGTAVGSRRFRDLPPRGTRTTPDGIPFLAWALGVGANRAELYPLHA